MSSHHYDREPDADSPQLDLEIEPIDIRQAVVDDDASRPINRRRGQEFSGGPIGVSRESYRFKQAF
jgi:hypothetical protein